jgi:hypothetical protein
LGRLWLGGGMVLTGVKWLGWGRTAGPSTALRSVEKQMGLPLRQLQISPLRFASVEMTSSWEDAAPVFHPLGWAVRAIGPPVEKLTVSA